MDSQQDEDLVVEEKARSASDVLVSLEGKVDLLSKMIAGADINTKLILDRLNKICLLLENIGNNVTSNNSLVPMEKKEEEFVSYSSEPIQLEKDPKGVRRTARPESYPEPKQEANATKVVPVFQKILKELGKPVFMAEIEVFDSSNNLVFKDRTSTSGKWQGVLLPGEYIVHVLKRENDKSSRIDHKSSFVVPVSATPVDLGTINV